MAKSYKLQVRGMGGDIETVRVYYACYDKAAILKPVPTKESAFVDSSWADFDQLDIYNNRRIDLLALGVFTDRDAVYKVGASFLNAEGDESGLVTLDEGFTLENPPADPGFLELIIEDIPES